MKWVSELIDLFKDQNYLYSLKHKTSQLLVLITSMCLPFAVFDLSSNTEDMKMHGEFLPAQIKTVTHNFMIYLGLFKEGDYVDAYLHTNTAVLLIQCLE